MNNWDPKEHPRDMRTGRFSESWISSVSAQLPGPASPGRGLAKDWMIDRIGALYQSRSFKHDISTWEFDEVSETVRVAGVVRDDDNLDDDERETGRWVHDILAKEQARLESLPPWEGGPPDYENRHYEAWKQRIRELIAEHGYDPDNELILGRLPWDDDTEGGDGYYHEVMHEDPRILVEGEIEDMEIEEDQNDLRTARNAIGVHKQAMESYDHPGAKEINLHLLAAHPDFSSSGLFEIYVPEVNDWALMEDQDWSEDDEILTIWAGDYYYELDIDDEASYIRRIA